MCLSAPLRVRLRGDCRGALGGASDWLRCALGVAWEGGKAFRVSFGLSAVITQAGSHEGKQAGRQAVKRSGNRVDNRASKPAT